VVERAELKAAANKEQERIASEREKLKAKAKAAGEKIAFERAGLDAANDRLTTRERVLNQKVAELEEAKSKLKGKIMNVDALLKILNEALQSDSEFNFNSQKKRKINKLEKAQLELQPQLQFEFQIQFQSRFQFQCQS